MDSNCHPRDRQKDFRSKSTRIIKLQIAENAQEAASGPQRFSRLKQFPTMPQLQDFPLSHYLDQSTRQVPFDAGRQTTSHPGAELDD